MRTVLYFALFLGIFAGIEKLLDRGLSRKAFSEENETNTGKWWTGYAVLALGWLPLLLIKYPAALCWDTWGMISEYMANTYSEHQSVLYTFVMGKLIEIFMQRGHSNWGIFIFSAVHYLILVASLGYSLQILRKMNAARPVRIAVLLSYLFNPYIAGYVGVVIKDIPYTAFLLIVHLSLIDLYMDHEKFASNPLKLGVLFFSVVQVWLLRKNGSYIMLAAGVFLLIRCAVKKKSKKPAIVLLAACLVSSVLFSFLGNHFDAVKGSVREALSVPFQQTARYVRDYGDEVTEEEREAINAVLDYEEIGRLYNPRISDKVKATYKEDGSKLPIYFKVWFDQFWKHPMCYVNATWEQLYYLFVPEVENIVLYQNLRTGYEIGMFMYIESNNPIYGILFVQKEELVKLQEWLIEVFERFHRMPVLGLLGNSYFWFYVLIIVTAVYMANGKDKGLIIAMLYFTMIFVLLGPVIQGHPRYMFPVIYALPAVTMFCLKDLR